MLKYNIRNQNLRETRNLYSTLSYNVPWWDLHHRRRPINLIYFKCNYLLLSDYDYPKYESTRASATAYHARCNNIIGLLRAATTFTRLCDCESVT